MKVLLTEEQIRERVEELAEELSHRYKGTELVAIILLKGAFIFAADLLRRINGVKIYCDFMKVSSYGMSKESTGQVKIVLQPTMELEGKQVLVVDDILDTGYTLKEVKRYILEQGAKSCEVCVLLDKPERRKVDFNADYVGFKIPNHFVVGYGMDCAEEHRTLPYVAAID
ncbi:hypoxanthine phosphoribosyltransferase [Thermosulfidibacter takaii ABI70S6]|uniref:Hypoxanthine phosphoribosyltransferase n=1 Tax=Thermosulfidibacter takaii (strain DSM 17441 / JCM 13301 / NBRC 103674 / ABI70S6) TaxID=1298851 RepID=A0A0S3QVZ6_THET7|nr:hypoxanthine phosphoribosyltransferase [Thermosulfidibacter takaii]BAT72491.1 hypoxanthine phosphoribosyltransferase [Thermosulfidibacter takaii ABI70S6]